MPSMSTSHGGVLYYVVKIPKSRSPVRTPSSLILDEKAVTSTPVAPYQYLNVDSTESGWDNPFRPDGDLSKEADEIVELIKEGKPITPTQANNPSKLIEGNGSVTIQNSITKINGNAPVENSVSTGVEVQHGTIAASAEGSQVEHVVIKKKPKCKCCVIQ